jgi:hypothetical protein
MPSLPATGESAIDASSVLLGNFDVERQWSEDEPDLPAPTRQAAMASVASMDELALLLGGPADWVLLKAPPDPGLLDQFVRVGLRTPRVLTADTSKPTSTVTQDVLASPSLLGRLRAIAHRGGRLAPHGFSEAEAELCRLTGLAAPMADPGIAKRVNSKVFSRRLCQIHGIEQPPGWECETLTDLVALTDTIRGRLAEGVPIGIKSAYGVSGRGIAILDRPDRFDRLLRHLSRRAERTGDGRLAVVVEEWQAKQVDLNYHLTVTATDVTFDFVLEAITDSGRHRGHRMPDQLAGDQRRRLIECAHVLGGLLRSEGYRGAVGVDAIICTDGTLFPVIEINARNNMSTYVARIRERMVAAGSCGLALQVDLELTAPVWFEDLAAVVAGLELDRDWRRGFLVTCIASANAAAALADRQGRFPGRLHGVVVAGSAEEAARLEREVRARLSGWERRR